MTIDVKIELDPRVELKARRTLDGNILILDHEDIDIVLTQSKNPLAFYVFSQNNKFINSLVKKYPFGGGVVNDSLVHFTNPNLPFGGIGNSGIGGYHGKYSFDLMSHTKPLVKRSFWFDPPQRYAPYPKSISLLKKILKRL